MSKRETFIDLDDYGRGDFCSRVNVLLEVDSPSDYYVDIEDAKTGELLNVSKLSYRDQDKIDRWVRATVKEVVSDFMDYASDQHERFGDSYD